MDEVADRLPVPCLLDERMRQRVARLVRGSYPRTGSTGTCGALASSMTALDRFGIRAVSSVRSTAPTGSTPPAQMIKAD